MVKLVEEMLRNYDSPRKGRGGRLPGWGGWDGKCRNAAPPARSEVRDVGPLPSGSAYRYTTTTDIGPILLRELITTSVCVYSCIA